MTGPGLGSPFGLAQSLLGSLGQTGSWQQASQQQEAALVRARWDRGLEPAPSWYQLDEPDKGPETVREELQRDTDRWLN